MTHISADPTDEVLACPECNAGGRWYVREDDTTRCSECHHECHRDDLVRRDNEKGEHTPYEAYRKGGKKGGSTHSDEHMREIGKKGGKPPKRDPTLMLE